MTELEKCLAGEYYDCHDKVFLEMKAVATQWMQRYNSLPYEQRKERYSMLKELFGHVGENCSVRNASSQRAHHRERKRIHLLCYRPDICPNKDWRNTAAGIRDRTWCQAPWP
ncbi:maltose acetyltransferase domain-containing protein [Bacteroides congonensis]|uniref:maltose acetyltransferase domain-containing protein n=1 Tax=Bacteroides congonensis TaxID=1871006 RepID=UPI00265EA665|nr:maltose acetyltransferase domain-containing protein [Bacteroides congonensis]